MSCPIGLPQAARRFLVSFLPGLPPRAVAAAAVAALFGCSPASSSPNEGSGGGVGAGGSGGGTLMLDGGGSGCSSEAKLVYVLTREYTIHSFKPDTKQFVEIGQLDCPTNGRPNSMAIDRNAVAWVNFVESDADSNDVAGTLFKVSTADASCEPAPAVDLPADWYRVGMGFSTDGPDTSTETLYVAAVRTGAGLGRIDLGSGTLHPIGSFTGSLAGQSAELTGTGDALLYGFFTSTPVEVAELDKSSGGALSSAPLPTVEVPRSWAFSFWGGDFYLYTATDGGSRVNRYRPSDGSVDTSYIDNVGFRIIGAGVSTCAPLTPPK